MTEVQKMIIASIIKTKGDDCSSIRGSDISDIMVCSECVLWKVCRYDCAGVLSPSIKERRLQEVMDKYIDVVLEYLL